MPLPLEPRRIARSAFFNGSVRVIVTVPVGHALKPVGTGADSNRTYEPILSLQQLAVLQVALESQDVRSVFIWWSLPPPAVGPRQLSGDETGDTMPPRPGPIPADARHMAGLRSDRNSEREV